jgi:condensin complex subunit 1
MAEFLHILSEQYDYPQLADEVLRSVEFGSATHPKRLIKYIRDLSNREFNNNDTRGPKSVSTFIIKLSELAPRLVNKQMTLLVKQLDSEVRLFDFASTHASDSGRPTLFGAPSLRFVVI